jgi:hypothetical protein
MLLKNLQAALGEFLAFLNGPKAAERLPLWEAQQIFQSNWDLEAPDLASMYERSLESTQTRRYWSGDDFRPREVMLGFMKQQQAFARQVFADLFREDRSVEGRLGRFVFSCDELLADHQERRPKDKLAAHYHGGDYRMAFLYLASATPTGIRCTTRRRSPDPSPDRRSGYPYQSRPGAVRQSKPYAVPVPFKDEAIQKAHALRLWKEGIIPAEHVAGI